MSKTILITGASTGIGAYTATTLAKDNTIFIHYNSSEDAAQKVAQEVEAAGGTAHLVQANLMTEDGCKQLFDQVSAKTDHLDVLINNAGGLLQRHQLHEFSWDLMNRIFALNTYSTMMMTTLCLPLLKKGSDPNVVNITSIAMRHGAPTATIYGASKAAIDSFTRGAAKELAPDIRVNAVAPGVIVTPFHDRYSTPERMETFRKNTPLQINGESEHIATAIRFLVENTFTTGETLDVNGGLFMR